MFAGLISIEQSISAWGDPDKILAALAPYSLDKPRDVWAADRQMLLQVATRTDATSAEIYRHLESGVAVAFWGRLDNRSELIAQLDAKHTSSDDELIALAWLKWGEYCPERLIGDFALALCSPKSGIALLARDVAGVKPLFYRADENGIFFASNASAFKMLKLGRLTRSQEWMAKFLTGISWSNTETAYEEISKLPRAHSLLIHADGRANLRNYHQYIDDAPIERKRDPKYLEAYRVAWQEAVSSRMPASGNIGTENSGGLDSGSICSEIARQLHGDIDRLYGYGFCYEDLEPEFIMASAMKHRLKHSVLFSHDPSSMKQEWLDREYKMLGYPAEHVNSLTHFPIYGHCHASGISTLFSGFGGDEAVTYPAVMQARSEFIDQREYLSLWRILPGNPVMRGCRLAKSFWQSRHRPSQHPDLLQYFVEQWKYRFVNDTVAGKFKLQANLLKSATYDEGFHSVNAAVLHLTARHFASTRLENCTLIAAGSGIEYVWPLWDQRLIQQWLSTPLIWKVGDGGISRYLHRCAVAGICPDKVTWKPSKNMGIAARQKIYAQEDNRPVLRQLLGLLEALPSELAELIDAEGLRTMAHVGIKQDWRGENINSILYTNTTQLQALYAWIAHDCQNIE